MSNRTPLDHITETVPPRFEGTYRRALGITIPTPSSPSRTAAIKCMCVQCQGWEDGVVEAVRTCADQTCPLWAVRPYQDKDEQETDEYDTEQGSAASSSDLSIDELIRQDEIKQRRVDALIKARAARAAKRAAEEGDQE